MAIAINVLIVTIFRSGDLGFQKEFKWSVGTLKPVGKNGSGTFPQFISYLKLGISNISDLEYWFDGEKLNAGDNNQKELQIKKEFQSMMFQRDSLTTQGKAVFNAIWSNENLRGKLFPETVGKTPQWLNDNKDRIKEEFGSQISETSDEFYNFIKVK